MPYNFICIEGNIGIGKTTLVKKLAAHFKAGSLYEEFDENPWLPLFYQNPKETALALELSFLTDRSKQLVKITGNEKIFSDYCIDKCLLFTKINLSPAEFDQYKKLHELVCKTVIRPNLVIVIHSTTENLLANIKQRGRSYEQNMEAAYLDKLNNSYKEFFSKEKPYYILNIFAGNLSITHYENMFDQIVSFLEQEPLQKITDTHL
ncbi:MAG TPA: deoxynucleoside kinase [Bacteroidia bacterium]|jgi:deoxyguanosine kinase|nr:deoxynucleoside kinase [Bacteroidia bacterium]